MRFLSYLTTLLVAVLFTACGGGGGSPGTTPGGQALFTTAPSALTLTLGSAQTFTIGGGQGPYSAASSDASVAVAGLNGTDLTLGAVTPGTADITLRDAKGATTVVSVTAKPVRALFTTAPASLTLGVGAAAAQTYQVGGGVAPYVVGSSNPTVLSAVLNGTNLTLTGLGAGAATVVVLDNVGASVSITVTVSNAGTMALFTTAPSSISLSIGETSSYSIGGGVAPYTVNSSNTAAVQVVGASGSTYSLKAVAVGSGSVVIRDSAGSTVIVAFTVTNRQMSLNPSTAKTFIGLTNYANIIGGVAPYTALSGFASVATVSVGTLSSSGVFTPDPFGNILKMVANQAADPDQIVVTDSLGNSANFSLTSSAGTLQEALNPNALTVSACFTGSIDLFLTGATGTTHLFSSDPTLVTVQPQVVGNGPTAVPVTVTKDLVTAAGVVQITAIDAGGASASSTITITAPATACP